jgi:two-component system LytT family sensor kinase
MLSPAVDVALVAAVIIITLAVVAVLGFRFSRSYRDLGSDADRATYATLHTVALASEHLRTGLTPSGASKAARHLRGLLRCRALLLTDANDVLAWDGTATAPAEVMRVAREVLASGRTQIFKQSQLGTVTGQEDDLARPRNERGRRVGGNPGGAGRAGLLPHPVDGSGGEGTAGADQPALHLQLAERHRLLHQHRSGTGA